jgi:hypothetical protein
MKGGANDIGACVCHARHANYRGTLHGSRVPFQINHVTFATESVCAMRFDYTIAKGQISQPASYSAKLCVYNY